MTRQQAESEPYHRQWLHALEDEPTAPSEVMSAARVYADFAPSSGGSHTRVSCRTMRHLTHMSYDLIEAANRWMITYGWLTAPPHKNGHRITYGLTMGSSGPKRRRPGKPAPRDDPASAAQPLRTTERPADENRSASRNALADDRSVTRNGHDRSAARNATVPRHGTPPFRAAERERQTSDTVSLARPTLHAALAAAVPDATERETDQIRDMIRQRPGVKSAVAVMRAEIRDGEGPALVAAIRARAAGTRPGTPSAPPVGDLCGYCSRTGHDTGDCPEAAEVRATASQPPVPAASRATGTPGTGAAGDNRPEHQRCRYDGCRTPPEPIERGYHATCERFAGVRGCLSPHEAAAATPAPLLTGRTHADRYVA